jgi:hypothetical protein
MGPQYVTAGLQLPPNGVLYARGNPAVAQFNVTTPPGQHYLIRLVNVEGLKKEEVTFFVRAGSNYEGKVPLGKYRIVGVHGSTWFGEKGFFGDQSVFFKARMKDGEEVFTFLKDAMGVHGKTISFQSTVDGNMHSAPIDQAEFEAD